MSIYTTPLQLGYFLSLLLALLFVVRGRRNQRLSDKLLGGLMFILALELQDYTFGFSGINVLWEELNGFPRGVNLLFGPTLYFYLKSQTNHQFQLQRHHLWHLLPWLFFTIIQLIFFLQGPEAVREWQSSQAGEVIAYLNTLTTWLSYTFYFWRSISLYRQYSHYVLSDFSYQEAVSLKWFRNFLFFMIFWVVSKELFFVLDLLFNLSFYQDWWWNLPLVVGTTYVGLSGLSQQQNQGLNFQGRCAATSASYHQSEIDQLAKNLREIMQKERWFLQPELKLKDLAVFMKTSASLLSTTINSSMNQNFNDYINGLRVQEFIARFEETKKVTVLSLALDCGFNSKATFNRAFKKVTGRSPREYFESEKSIFKVL